MEKLIKLFERCKCSVSIEKDPHKDLYQTVHEWMEDTDSIKDVSNDVFEEMKNRDKIIHIHLYPDTPIGFYVIFHYDLETAIDLALKCVEYET